MYLTEFMIEFISYNGILDLSHIGFLICYQLINYIANYIKLKIFSWSNTSIEKKPKIKSHLALF